MVSYYEPAPRRDTPTLIPHIQVPVIAFAGSEDRVVKGLIEKVEPLADGECVRLEVAEGADHFFRDLYSEDIADIIAWGELTSVDNITLAETLDSIRTRGRFIPGTRDPLRGWWLSHLPD